MSKAYIKELLEMSDDSLNAELENINISDFRQALKLAMKEQDRDTRHACAEAVLVYKTIGVASAAYMNARAIK